METVQTFSQGSPESACRPSIDSYIMGFFSEQDAIHLA